MNDLNVEIQGIFPTSVAIETNRTHISNTNFQRNIKKKMAFDEISKISSDFIPEILSSRNMKIDLNSPRTKKAMKNLGIDKSECILKNPENFFTTQSRDEFQKLKYIYHSNEIYTNIKAIIKERQKLKKYEENLKNFQTTSTFSDKDSFSPIATSYMAMTTEQKLSKFASRQGKYDRIIKNKANDILRQSQLKFDAHQEWEKEQLKLMKYKEAIEKKRKAELIEKNRKFDAVLTKAKEKFQETQEIMEEKQKKKAEDHNELLDKINDAENTKSLAYRYRQLEESREKRMKEVFQKRRENELKEKLEIMNKLSLLDQKRLKAEILFQKEQQKKISAISEKLQKNDEKKEISNRLRAEKEKEYIFMYSEKFEKLEKRKLEKAKTLDQLSKTNTMKFLKDDERINRNIDSLKYKEEQKVLSLKEKNEEKLQKLQKFLDDKRMRNQEKASINKEKLFQNLYKSSLINEGYEKQMHHLLRRDIEQKQKINQIKKEQEDVVQKIIRDHLRLTYKHEKILNKAISRAKSDFFSPNKTSVQLKLNLSDDFEVQLEKEDEEVQFIKSKYGILSNRNLKFKKI